MFSLDHLANPSVDHMNIPLILTSSLTIGGNGVALNKRIKTVADSHIKQLSYFNFCQTASFVTSFQSNVGSGAHTDTPINSPVCNLHQKKIQSQKEILRPALPSSLGHKKYEVVFITKSNGTRKSTTRNRLPRDSITC